MRSRCQRLLLKAINPETVLELATVADAVSDKPLLDAAIKFWTTDPSRSGRIHSFFGLHAQSHMHLPACITASLSIAAGVSQHAYVDCAAEF